MYIFKKDYREVTESTEPQNSLEINDDGREEGVKIDFRLLFLIIVLVVS